MGNRTKAWWHSHIQRWQPKPGNFLFSTKWSCYWLTLDSDTPMSPDSSHLAASGVACEAWTWCYLKDTLNDSSQIPYSTLVPHLSKCFKIIKYLRWNKSMEKRLMNPFYPPPCLWSEMLWVIPPMDMFPPLSSVEIITILNLGFLILKMHTFIYP